MAKANVTIIEAQMGEGKTLTATAIIIDEYFAHIYEIVSPRGTVFQVKPSCLEEVWLQPPPELQGKAEPFLITIPKGWKTHSTVKIFANYHLFGFEYGLTAAYGSDTTHIAQTTTGQFNQNLSQVYTMGDSLTRSTMGQNQLGVLLGKTKWNVNNNGTDGNTTTQMLARFNADIIVPGDANTVTVWGGVNDALAGTSAATIEANLQAMYTAAHNAGIKVVAVTISPFKGYLGGGGWSAGKQTVVDAVNSWIMNTATNIDYKVDMWSALEDPGNPDTLLAAYDGGDHLHLGSAGNAGYIFAGATIYNNATFTQNYTYPSLTPGQTYHYRAVMNNGTDTAYGADQTFTFTLPTVTTQSSSNRTFNGNITNLGVATNTYGRFEYGLTAAYGYVTPLVTKSATGAFTASMPDTLIPGTTYHYRAKTSNGGVVSNGADSTFVFPYRSNINSSSSTARGTIPVLFVAILIVGLAGILIATENVTLGIIVAAVAIIMIGISILSAVQSALNSL